MLEGINFRMSKPLINEVEVVYINVVFNSSLRSWQWLLIGAKEVWVFRLSLRLRQSLLVGVEEVKVSNLSQKPL